MLARALQLNLALIAATAVLCGALAAPAQAQLMHKHAVLIGISNYHHYNASGIFPDLDCDEDVRQIKAALVHTFRFDPDPKSGEITTLTTPAQTTHAAILHALKTLVQEAKPGDLVYIHYSGHGDQILDPTEPTGLDSTIVPCDYKDAPPDKRTEAATNEIAGKTILEYVHQLQHDLQGKGQIVLSFDSCHSASAARGAAPTAKKRGISFAEYVAWYKQTHPDYQGAPTPQRSRMLARGASTDNAWEDLPGAGYVVIAACRNEDSAYETSSAPAMGRLSDCLAQVLTQAQPDTTYQQVFNQVNALFHEKYNDQFPQLDGDPNTTLFGGAAVPPPPSIQVKVDSPGHYTLDAGSLQGMTRGSRFAVYSRHAADFTPANEIAEAQITAVDLTTATLDLTKKLKPGLTSDDLLAAQAVETQHNYSRPPLSLDADSLRRELPAQADAILAKLADLKMVRTTLQPGETPDIKVARVSRDASGRGPAELALVRASSGYAIQPLDESGKDTADTVYQALQREARYRYACGLGANQSGLNASYRVKIRIVPVQVGTDDDGHEIVLSAGQPLGPKDHLSVGDHFVIEVQNNSSKDLHLAVLDLSSDGNVDPEWPAPHSGESDNIVKAGTGKWMRLWIGSDVNRTAIYHAKTADPGEIYKAIATDEYVSFAALKTRGRDRGPDSPFSDIFGPAVDEGTRGTGMDDPGDPGSWTAADDSFQVQ